MLKRAALIGAALLLSSTAACSSGAGSDQPSAPKPTGSQINDPKDASAVAPCGYLTPETANAIGLDPVGHEQKDLLDDKGPTGCNWAIPGGNAGNDVTLTPLNDRSLQMYYQGKAQFSDFQELTIAGHPAVRANKGDPAKDGMCLMYVGTKDGQVLEAATGIDPAKGLDSCDLAHKALEAAVPALPAAK